MANVRLNEASKALLLSIAAATELAPHVIPDMADPSVKKLVDAGFIFTNDKAKTDAGTPAVLSPAGQEKAKSYAPAENARGPRPNPEDFEIEDGIAVPEGRRAAPAASIYPFDKLGVGQSFFIPPTENSDNPAKAKQSTVTTQNKREAKRFEDAKAAGSITDPAAVPVKFKIGPDTKGDIKGARVWRIQ